MATSKVFIFNAIADGVAASGALFNSFARNTSTRLPLYTDVALTVPATNPVVADSNGRFVVYFDQDLEYTWRITTANGATTIIQADVINGVLSNISGDTLYIDSSWLAALTHQSPRVAYVSDEDEFDAAIEEFTVSQTDFGGTVVWTPRGQITLTRPCVVPAMTALGSEYRSGIIVKSDPGLLFKLDAAFPANRGAFEANGGAVKFEDIFISNPNGVSGAKGIWLKGDTQSAQSTVAGALITNCEAREFAEGFRNDNYLKWTFAFCRGVNNTQHLYIPNGGQEGSLLMFTVSGGSVGYIGETGWPPEGRVLNGIFGTLLDGGLTIAAGTAYECSNWNIDVTGSGYPLSIIATQFTPTPRSNFNNIWLTGGTNCIRIIGPVAKTSFFGLDVQSASGDNVYLDGSARADGVESTAALAIGSTNTRVANGAFTYTLNATSGIAKGAVAAGTALGTDVIPATKYGAVALDINAAGTITAISAVDNATGYANAGAAVTGLPDPQYGYIRMGYVTMMKSDGAFTLGTTALNAANTTVAYTSASNLVSNVYSAPAISDIEFHGLRSNSSGGADFYAKGARVQFHGGTLASTVSINEADNDVRADYFGTIVSGAITALSTNSYFAGRIGTNAYHAPFPQNFLDGFTLTNNASDATNDIDFAAGKCRDSTNRLNLIGSAMTKRLDAVWVAGTNQGGLDTGSIANTTYHCFAILKTSDHSVDYLFSASPTAPTMPSGYTRFRRIGSIIRSGGTILGFTQRGDEFLLLTQVLDVNVADPGTGYDLRTLTVPVGIQVGALICGTLYDATPGSSVQLSVLSPDQGSADVGIMAYIISNGGGTAASSPVTTNRPIRTNTSSQIKTKLNVSNGDIGMLMYTCGWTDDRIV